MQSGVYRVGKPRTGDEGAGELLRIGAVAAVVVGGQWIQIGVIFRNFLDDGRFELKFAGFGFKTVFCVGSGNIGLKLDRKSVV